MLNTGSTAIIRLWKAVLGVLFCFLFWLASFLGSIFVQGPFLIFIFLWPRIYGRWAELTTEIWQGAVVAILEKVGRVKVVITGDAIHRHEKTLVIMNHRTRLDWIFFFCCALRFRVLDRLKILLKSQLKWIPGAGWSMQMCRFIFLERRWNIDKQHITNMLNHFVVLKACPTYLLFPEGTDLTPGTKSSSDIYAEKNGLQKYNYVLHPRTTGFSHMVQTLRQVGEIHAVDDVTVAYPKALVQTEMGLLVGEVPDEVHFHIKRYGIHELPVDEDGLSEWCKERWKEKEELLREYYNGTCNAKGTQQFAANRRFPNDKVSSSNHGLMLGFRFAVWLAILTSCIILVTMSSICRYFMFFFILFQFAQSRLFGGVEKMEILIYEMLHRRRNGAPHSSTGL